MKRHRPLSRMPGPLASLHLLVLLLLGGIAGGCGGPGEPTPERPAKVFELPSPWDRRLSSCRIYPHMEYDHTRFACFARPDRFHFTDCRPGRCRAVRFKIHYLLPWDLGPHGTLTLVARPAAQPVDGAVAVTRRIRYRASAGSAPEEILFVENRTRYCFEARITGDPNETFEEGAVTTVYSDRLCAEVGDDTSLWFGDLFAGWGE